MQLSTRGRYAVMAMVELAARHQCCAHPVTLGEIASGQQLSLCYLEQLFGGLRRAGLVVSARGPGGGYRLGRPACAVTIADILGAVDEPLHATRCTGEPVGCLPGEDSEQRRCQTQDLWEELGRHIQLFLGGVTLDHVLTGRVCGSALARGQSVAAE